MVWEMEHAAKHDLPTLHLFYALGGKNTYKSTQDLPHLLEWEAPKYILLRCI